ncbi:hypothetical protein LZC95_05225 [Pendulispora brunnea]|uniref:Uncharacterized protein n=1 Tax=Pendulispora brunnea TaxID=2905690 RepID=A0ABZ2KC95_9BACT
MEFVRELCRIGGSTIVGQKVDIARLRAAFGDDESAHAVSSLLAIKNGFYAFNQALHVFSDAGTPREPGLIEWNSPKCWKQFYGAAARGIHFAEDCFGNQFQCIDGRISLLTVDRATSRVIAETIDDWAHLILDDPCRWAKQHVSDEWQRKYGRLAPGDRLVTEISPLAGGDFSHLNARAEEEIEAMRYRGRRLRELQKHPCERINWH